MELARPFAISQPAISKHLKVLEHAGLISRSRAAQSRPAKLEAGPLREATAWLETYRRHWNQSFDRLDNLLQTLQAAAPAEIPAEAPLKKRKKKKKEKKHDRKRK